MTEAVSDERIEFKYSIKLNENSDIIDILKSEKDISVYDALNKAISLAKGKYISILHSDDHYESNNVLEIIFKTRFE